GRRCGGWWKGFGVGTRGCGILRIIIGHGLNYLRPRYAFAITAKIRLLLNININARRAYSQSSVTQPMEL
ncbi:MAG: hypothetical protein ACP5I8_12940, partial [Phycisphaerae bacterium]